MNTKLQINLFKVHDDHLAQFRSNPATSFLNLLPREVLLNHVEGTFQLQQSHLSKKTQCARKDSLPI